MTFDVAAEFRKAWDENLSERKKHSPSFEIEDYSITGVAPVKYGKKKNIDWWLDFGPQMVQDWIDWRLAERWSVLAIDGKPAIEVELNFQIPGVEVPVKSFIDRVMVTRAGEGAIVDLKGLSVDTPLATPTGWTTMGQVQVGDEVFGKDGKPTRVTAKSDVKWLDCFRVVFDDKSSVVCDAEHLWETTTGSRNQTTSVKPIRDIAKTLRSAKTGQRDHRVAMPAPLRTEPAELPIDPYVLGAWLGDGNRGRGVITKSDDDLWSEIAARGRHIGVPQVDKRNGCVTRTVLGLQTELAAAGLLNHKHVPAAYLRASVEQRLDLLRGLMDTDGTYNTARKDVTFYSCDKGIALAVEELVLSLGERPSVYEVQRKGFGLTVTSYDVRWNPQVFNPFVMARKRDQVDMSRVSAKSRRRMIVAVEPIPSVPTQCIAVDADDSMYLAGERMVPTHNTGRTPETAEQLGLYRVGLGIVHNIWVDWGYFWSPGGKGHGNPIDLRAWTPERFAVMFNNSINAINAKAFNPSPANNCKNWCGVARYCAVTGGSEAAGVDSLAV